jgi:hypothetical protein
LLWEVAAGKRRWRRLFCPDSAIAGSLPHAMLMPSRCQVTKEDYASMHGVTGDGGIFALGCKKRRRDQLNPSSAPRSVKSRLF